MFGEVGLGGEVRGASRAGLRVKEAVQLGFTRCVLPAGDLPGLDQDVACDLVGVDTVEAALEALLE